MRTCTEPGVLETLNGCPAGGFLYVHLGSSCCKTRNQSTHVAHCSIPQIVEECTYALNDHITKVEYEWCYYLTSYLMYLS